MEPEKFEARKEVRHPAAMLSTDKAKVSKMSESDNNQIAFYEIEDGKVRIETFEKRSLSVIPIRQFRKGDAVEKA